MILINGQWTIENDTQSHTLRFIEYEPIVIRNYGGAADQVWRGYPNEDAFARTFNTLNMVQTMDGFDQFITDRLEDASALNISHEQFINLLQLYAAGQYLNLNLNVHNFPGNSTIFETLLERGLFPPVYSLSHIIANIHDLDLIKRIDHVSKSYDKDIYGDILEYMDNSQEHKDFYMELVEYLASIGVRPNMGNIRYIVTYYKEDPDLIDLIKIWMEYNLIDNIKMAIDYSIKKGIDDITSILVSGYQPTKSARKR